MFDYFNSEYHESLVNQLLPFANEPIDIRSSANIDDLAGWLEATAGQFTV
jgi:enterochelin esterase-like enzyme